MQVAYGWAPDSDWGTNPLWQANLNEGQTLKNASYHYLITDHLGTPQLAINSAGEQSWKITSDAFGNSELDANNQITMNLKFPGQYYDEETGLSYNYFRDYDAKTGRYNQNDPIGLAGGVNTYGYVGGNPLVYSDPTGEFVPALLVAGEIAVTGIRLCAITPSCRYYAGALISLGIRALLYPTPTLPMLNDNKSQDKKDCETKNVEISDTNSQNTVGGSSDPDDGKNKSKESKKYTKHGEMRRKQARTDKHRQVGDVNRVKRDGKPYYDTETGNNVYILGDRVVIETSEGAHVTQMINTRARIDRGKWIRKESE